MSAVLTTRLKITDLTAETALETGRRLLPEGVSLERLVREEFYLFEPAPGHAATAFEAPLERAIESSNFFVNPNKERYRLLKSAARGDSIALPDGAWGILARSRGDTRDGVLLDRLLREHPLPGLGAIRRARVWWLWTSGPRGNASIEACHLALGPVEGARRGLLTNPHAEASLLLDAPLKWARVEEFVPRLCRRAPSAMTAEASRFVSVDEIEAGIHSKERSVIEQDAGGAGQAEDRFREECGVFGIHGAENAARLTYAGLYSLQHRGQESAGIVSTDGGEFRAHRGLGLVSDVFSGGELERLTGHIAIGHNRYSTTGRNHSSNAQPLVVNFREGEMAIGHNGNLVNALALRREMEEQGSIFQTTSDTEVILHLIARSKATELERMIPEALARCQGAYSLVLLAGETLIGVRDPRGFRPLCLGKRDDAHVLASETCALDIVGAEFVREIEPGEMVLIDNRGVRSIRFHAPDPLRACVFELIYFSRPDSVVFGVSVDSIRRRLGRRLAEEHPAEADIVISVPDSSNSAALGFSERSGIPFELGLIRNHYVGRTFIAPEQITRSFGVNLKFNPVRQILEGKRVIVVDDSIVRGTTSRSLVMMIRGAGAKEVHFRVSSPPIGWSCYYGIDTPNRHELIASSHTVEQIRKYLHVDSLGYLSMEGLRSCVERPDDHCYACFNGDYSVRFGAEMDKLALERAPVRNGTV